MLTYELEAVRPGNPGKTGVHTYHHGEPSDDIHPQPSFPWLILLFHPALAMLSKYSINVSASNQML